MLSTGPAALESAKRQNAMFKPVKIVTPTLTFSEGALSLRVGKKSLMLMLTPGHSRDGISVFVEEDRVLFAGDAFLPLPYIVDGDLAVMANTIKTIGKMGLENIVQGHGDIILRGEIDDAIKENLAYLSALRKAVRAAARRRNPLDALAQIDVESCGKSRVCLGGLAEDLHRRNVRVLYRQIASEEAVTESDVPEAVAEEEEE
jgi:glyoxylase-like metal-dependent hydrolase (beta-lactamase superfamily II)